MDNMDWLDYLCIIGYIIWFVGIVLLIKHLNKG